MFQLPRTSDLTIGKASLFFTFLLVGAQREFSFKKLVKLEPNK